MNPTKYWELVCDGCGNAEHMTGTKAQAMKWFRSVGHIFTKGKSYCDKKCVPTKAQKPDDGEKGE